MEEGVQRAEEFATGGTGNVYLTVQNILYAALGFLAITALIVIIIAGITLLVGGHSEEQRTKAKNILIYAFLGLLMVFFATAIVRYVMNRIFL